MRMKLTNEQRAAKRAKDAADKRINAIYSKNCSGVEINIMDIGKVFKAGHDALMMTPGLNNDQLAKVIVDFVQTVRMN